MLLAALALVGGGFAEHRYVVQAGDTLTSIAREHDTEVEALRSRNRLSGDFLRVGQVLELPVAHVRGFGRRFAPPGASLVSLAAELDLRVETLRAANPEIDGVGDLGGRLLLIPPGDGITVRAAPGETLEDVAARYGDDPAALAERSGLAPGESLAAGQPLLLAERTSQPALGGSQPLDPGERPTPPAADASSDAGAQPAPAGAWNGVEAGDGLELQLALLRHLPELLANVDADPMGFGLPLADGDARRITSRYGWRSISVAGNRFHNGIDYGAEPGTPVLAARDGTVTAAGWMGSYGYAVYLDHGDGVQTRYAHLRRVSVRTGAFVRRGDRIGSVGSSGASTGPHLHFEIRLQGRSLDPLGVLPAPSVFD